MKNYKNKHGQFFSTHDPRVKMDAILRVTKRGGVILKSQAKSRQLKIQKTSSLTKKNLDGLHNKLVTKTLTVPSQPVFIVSEKLTVGFKFVKVRYNDFVSRKVSLTAAVVGLLCMFVLGSLSAIHTVQTSADLSASPSVLGAETSTPPGSMVLNGLSLPSGSASEVQNGALFNTPIEYLQSYLASANQPDALELRIEKINQFLKDMGSPLVGASDTIAKQNHWKLILAIGFAESTLGKNCNDYNCSNIGVGPGSPHWRKYASYSDWVVDFNDLLERKYKDWTLEQMCGVYVQPCNDNWLLATQQILDKLDERGIQ